MVEPGDESRGGERLRMEKKADIDNSSNTAYLGTCTCSKKRIQNVKKITILVWVPQNHREQEV